MNKKYLVFTFTLFLLISGISFTLAAYAAEPPLIMGIFPRRNATDTVKLFKPMTEYLSNQLGREIKLVTSKDFKSFWEGVTSRQYDIVHFNQYHYILSNEKHGYQVILKNSEFGESTIAGSIVVRKDSGINEIKDLKGKTVVFGGGPKAMQSYIVARYLLQQGGLNKGDYTEEFAKNPPNAIFSTYYKQSAAAGSGDKVLNLDVVTKQINIDDMKILSVGDQLAHLPWAVKDSMDKGLREKIQQILSDLENSAEGKEILEKAKLSGLKKADDAEFNPHRAIVKAVYPNGEN